MTGMSGEICFKCIWVLVIYQRLKENIGVIVERLRKGTAFIISSSSYVPVIIILLLGSWCQILIRILISLWPVGLTR